MNNSRFEEIAIKDLCLKLTDYVANGSFKTIADNVNYQTTGYARLIRLLDYNNDYDLKDSVWVDKKGYDFLKKSSLFGGEIIISNVGEYAGTVFLAPKLPYPTTLAPNSIMLTTKDNDLFYYYYFKSPLGYKQIRNIVSSSGQPKFNKTNFKEIIVPRPDLKYQEYVANYLYTIDKKIANNKKINSELESMAKTLYDYWFLQFEFPNAEGKPYKSSGGKMVYNELLKKEIPEGWELKKVKDLLNVVTGKEDSNFATSNGSYKFFTCSQEILQCDNYAFDGKAVLLAGNGDFNVKHYQGKFNAYQRTYVLIPNDYLYFGSIYMATTKLVKKLKAGSNGSIVKFITKGDVENIEILKPTDNKLLETFNNILTFIEKNNEENQELTSLRDFLLPLLMNGQVTIQDAEEQVKNTISDIWNAEKLLRFAQWKHAQGYAARGEVDDKILKKIFDAMDKDAKN